MNKKSTKNKSKVLMLIAAMLMMLLLCGCRVRVSNNSEVLATMDDESGWLQETYQQRRDELGIPVAKEPIINREGEEYYDGEEGEDGEYYYDYDEDGEAYDDEGYYDEDEEDDEDGEDGADTPVRSTTPVVRRTVPVVRRTVPTPVRPVTPTPVRPTTPTVKSITVTLNLNASDAKCSRPSMNVIKGSTYGAMPVPTREGYTFKGWYTEKSGGKEVTSTTKVTADKAHTLYAHWKKSEKKEDPEENKQNEQNEQNEQNQQNEQNEQNEQNQQNEQNEQNEQNQQNEQNEQNQQKQHKVVFEVNVPDGSEVFLDTTEITVEEDGKYGDLPVPVRDTQKFAGWYTEPDGGTKVDKDSIFSLKGDQTLYAHWSDFMSWWDKRFSETANGIKADSKVKAVIDKGSDRDKEKKLVEDCKIDLATDKETPEYIVKIIEKYSTKSAKSAAEELYASASADNPDVKVVIVSDKALKGSDEQKLLYKMMILDAIYGSFGDKIDEAANDLGVASDVDYPYVYPQE